VHLSSSDFDVASNMVDCIGFFMIGYVHNHKTEISWRLKTAKEYRKTAKENFLGGAPSSMNRQVWLARKIELSWRLTPKHDFLDCQPAKENIDILCSQGNESAVNPPRKT
jgi:hypothetical protein